MADRINMREEALNVLMNMEKTGRLSHLVMGEALMRLQFAPKNERAFFYYALRRSNRTENLP